MCLYWLDGNPSGYDYILTKPEAAPPKRSFRYAVIHGRQNHVKVARMVMGVGVVAGHVWLCLPIKTSKWNIAKQHSYLVLV